MSNIIIFLCVSDIWKRAFEMSWIMDRPSYWKLNKKIESTTVEINFSSPAESGRNRDPLLSIFV